VTALPNLQALRIYDSELTSLPEIWTAESLRHFTASRIWIVGKIPVQHETLRWLALGDNKMSGDLNEFSKAISKHNRLHSLSLA
jgi:hypothetical protein